ncbi:glycosyltransferase family 2 protein [Halorubrum sp. Hd13]|uniref:glycosyltransferase n=1 Tax=Halorubrum sp. Hd13 TaxID=1480728 RepID=UPI000B9855EC|nr:glycosyltransferase [Halorubrum sp. Hd13]OYR42834.1 glycosyltransferase [Halorubrum sp. Hd13]
MPSHSVSIVIPVYNDPVGIRNTLASISSLRGFHDLTVFVVDNGSTDHTREVIQDYTNEYQNIHLLVEDEIQGSYAARNVGIEHTKSDIIAFLDANETIDNDWFETALDAMQRQNADYLGCNVELTLPTDTLVGRYDVRTGFPVEWYLREEHYAPTCALVVRRYVFDDIGQFDARLTSGGDREFGERVFEAGYTQGYAADATVFHPARTSVKSLGKKNFRVGRGFTQKQRYYPDRFGRPGLPPTPTRPSGNDAEESPISVFTRIVFFFLSVAMLATRGLGYYYEFLFGTKRNLRAPTR